MTVLSILWQVKITYISYLRLMVKKLGYKKEVWNHIECYLSFGSLFQDCDNSQPPGGPQWSLPFAIHAHIISALLYVIDRIWQMWWCMTSEAKSEKTLPLLPCFLGWPTLGEANCHVVRTFKPSIEIYVEVRPSANSRQFTSLSAIWKNGLGKRVL